MFDRHFERPTTSPLGVDTTLEHEEPYLLMIDPDANSSGGQTILGTDKQIRADGPEHSASGQDQ
jgi:hypothetical protein